MVFSRKVSEGSSSKGRALQKGGHTGPPCPRIFMQVQASNTYAQALKGVLEGYRYRTDEFRTIVDLH